MYVLDGHLSPYCILKINLQLILTSDVNISIVTTLQALSSGIFTKILQAKHSYLHFVFLKNTHYRLWIRYISQGHPTKIMC